jgi:hypothetical protein
MNYLYIMILSYILMLRHQLQTEQSNSFIAHITRWYALPQWITKLQTTGFSYFENICKCVCRNWRHSGIYYTWCNNFSLNIQVWIHCDIMAIKYNILLIWFLLFFLYVSPTLAEFYLIIIVFLVLCPDMWVNTLLVFPTFCYWQTNP